MAFEIITAEVRTASMTEWFSGICRSITDFVVGSKIRSKFETIAVTMEEQDYAFYQAVKKAIPTSIYESFEFTLNPAIKASGLVTFTADIAPLENLTIPKGTKLATQLTDGNTEKVYSVDNETTLLAGQTTVTAKVSAVSTGTQGNTPFGTITTAKDNIPGIDSVTNTTAIESGRDRETETERRIRFRSYINTLSRSTAAAIEYGAGTAQLVEADGTITERVFFAKVSEPFLADPENPAGYIYCYIYNGTGNTSGALIDEAQKIINGYTASDGTRVPGYKAAGVACTVYAPVQLPVNITMNVTAAGGKSVAEKAAMKTTIENLIARHQASMNMGQTLLRSRLIDIAMGVSGVYNVELEAPPTNITVGDDTIVVPAATTVTMN